MNRIASRIVAAICWTGAAAVVLYVAALLYLYSRSDADTRCLLDVRPGSPVQDGAIPVPDISWFPLGLQCTFTGSDGNALVVHPDWTLSMLVGVAIVLVILGAVFLTRSRRVSGE